MLDAKLVVMDEPTAALGVSQTALVLDIIEQLASRGIAVLVISHNLTDVFRVADRLAVLYLGRLVSDRAGGQLRHQLGRPLDDHRGRLRTAAARAGRRRTAEHGGLSRDIR